MTRFFIKCAIFVALVFLVDLAFGFVMKSALTTTTKGDWGRRNYILNETHEDILIFGSSRAIHHYDPNIFEDSLQMTCCNCAEDGSGILLHYPRMEAILERYQPKMVIYDLIPQYDFWNFGEINSLGRLRPYSDILPVSKFIEDIDKTEKLKLCSSLYKFNSSFVEILQQRFSSASMSSAKFTYGALEGVLDSVTSKDSEFDGDGLDFVKFKYLNEFVDLCQKHGVKMIFTASPWYKMEYQDAYGPIEKMCKEKNILFLNHNFDTYFNNDKHYFHDAAHMNRHGAEVFSSVIAHEIKAYMQ